MTSARRLRERLATGEPLLLPGAYNALAAKILELAGHEAVYTGGYAAAAANWALPDIGLMTQTEMLGHIGRVTTATSLPVVSDADTGFGDIINVARTVREYEKAGAAAVQFEDQVFPKKCGHMEGKKVIPMEEMVSKVRAALAARTNPDTLIIARTDAIAVTGLEDAIRRMNAYHAAGADVIFPDAPRSLEELSAIRAAVAPEAKLLANFSENGKTPLLSVKEVGALGYAIALYPSSLLFAAVKSAQEIAALLKGEGSSRNAVDRMVGFDDLNDGILGKADWQAEEERILALG